MRMMQQNAQNAVEHYKSRVPKENAAQTTTVLDPVNAAKWAMSVSGFLTEEL